MSDLISRQAAMDTLKMDYTIIPYTKAREYVKATLDEIWDRLDKLPTAVSKRQKGKWVKLHGYVTPGGDPVWCCSECGKGIHVYGIEHASYGADIADRQWVACPNCGAMMEGEEE